MTKRKKKLEVTAEEFAAWREDPVTQFAVRELAKAAELQKAAWLAASWEAGMADEKLLLEFKTRADAYQALAELSYEDLMGISE